MYIYKYMNIFMLIVILHYTTTVTTPPSHLLS